MIKILQKNLFGAYVDARYYNYELDNTIKTFYKKIDNALKIKSEELIKREPRKKEVIDNTLLFFQYYYYFDNVRKRQY